jgi:membrane protein CcdC involved in cytochrome C biogenesis
MVEIGTVSGISKLSIWLSGAFAVLSIGLLYLYIAMTDASASQKVLWAAGLSIAVAFIFLVSWTMARDVVREKERELRRV